MERKPSPVSTQDWPNLPIKPEQRNRIKMIVSDVDGTLLNPKHEFTERTCKALRHVLGKDSTETGIRFVIATGKARPATDDIRKALDLDTGKVLHPALHLNGSIVYDDNGKVLESVSLLPQVSAQCMKIVDNEADVEKVDLEWGLYTDRVLRMACPPDSRFHSLLKDGYKEETVWEKDGESVKRQVADGGLKVNKVLVCGEDVELKKFEEILHRDEILSKHCPPKAPIGSSDCDYILTQAVPFIKELTPAATSKGHGVETLMKHYNLEPDQVLIFGDGDNDASMLGLPGVWSCCMENGMPGAKSVAKYVWPRGNKDDALAEVLEYIWEFGQHGNSLRG